MLDFRLPHLLPVDHRGGELLPAMSPIGWQSLQFVPEARSPADLSDRATRIVQAHGSLVAFNVAVARTEISRLPEFSNALRPRQGSDRAEGRQQGGNADRPASHRPRETGSAASAVLRNATGAAREPLHDEPIGSDPWLGVHTGFTRARQQQV